MSTGGCGCRTHLSSNFAASCIAVLALAFSTKSISSCVKVYPSLFFHATLALQKACTLSLDAGSTTEPGKGKSVYSSPFIKDIRADQRPPRTRGFRRRSKKPATPPLSGCATNPFSEAACWSYPVGSAEEAEGRAGRKERKSNDKRSKLGRSSARARHSRNQDALSAPSLRRQQA